MGIPIPIIHLIEHRRVKFPPPHQSFLCANISYVKIQNLINSMYFVVCINYILIKEE